MTLDDLIPLPVLPLRERPILPGIQTTIAAGRPGTIAAIEAARRGDRRVFAVAQLSNEDEVDPGRLRPVGVVATIGQLQRTPVGIRLVLTVDRRGRAARYEETEGYLTAHVREVEEAPEALPDDPAFLALLLELRQRAADLGRENGLPEEMVDGVLSSVDDPGRLADLIASHLDLSADELAAVLEATATEDRLRLVLLKLQHQLDVAEAQRDIHSKVREELGERQRELLLREQLKAIQDELGEGEAGDELDELKRRLAALELAPAVRAEVDRELGRLTRMGPQSMESQVIRSWLETVAELPWNTLTEDRYDLPVAESTLDEDHYGLRDVKERVLEYLAVRQLRATRDDDDTVTRAPILLFAGPPGVGKTSIGRSIARALGREYVRVSLGGARDEADIRGHRRTYVGAMPGRILAGLRQAGTRNPVLLLDEIDKTGVSMQGNPASALLEVLDPAQNSGFVDHYLGLPFDLSEVLFIATANLVEPIPAPLLDRMEVVRFSGYTTEEKAEIARRYLLPRQRTENGLLPDQLALTDEGLADVISRHTREAGVRQLERRLGKLARKAARRIATGADPAPALDPEEVRHQLGRPRVHPEQIGSVDQVGVATGMYYTPVGGDIMFVEATTMRGQGGLQLTGQLGDVMQESAHAAWSFARSHAAELNIAEEMFGRDVHIHVPAGAVPKDGPSAGVTMTAALVSALTGVPLRREVAMTGEVTLTGRVLPVGGIKEKVLGAVRAGITEVVLPRANEADLEDLPEHAREAIGFTFAADLEDVLRIALARPGSATGTTRAAPTPAPIV